MSKVALVQVVYNSIKYIPQVFPAALNQTHPDCKFYAMIAGSEDGSKEYIAKHFPEVEIIDPGYNIGFSKGHNELFLKLDVEFFQLINPDLIITPNFVAEMLKPFADEKVGAVSGKILRYDFDQNQPTNRIDTTGVVMSKSGRGRDRGQHEVDVGQYDRLTNIFGVSGAAAMYRKTALDDVKYLREDGRTEYFDEDFHSYWEDVDLSWRMINRAWKIRYTPDAIAYHGRAAASSPGGYKKIISFIKHHRAIPARIRQLNYKNHLFLFIKNSPRWYWQFFAREFFYQIYVLIFETSTLKILPTFFGQHRAMLRKRKYIQTHRKNPVAEIEKLFQ
ncbi:MAG TPA: glycosyltransferase family 2 protein [Candidatus Doudnabacteria bacterium]|nr:glycosyltransferase family 2 protein [Candidatus Doudnabacteria bacterium]